MGDNYRRKQNEKKRICPSGGFNISNASVPRDQHFKHQYPYGRAAKTSGAETEQKFKAKISMTISEEMEPIIGSGYLIDQGNVRSIRVEEYEDQKRYNVD